MKKSKENIDKSITYSEALKEMETCELFGKPGSKTRIEYEEWLKEIQKRKKII